MDNKYEYVNRLVDVAKSTHAKRPFGHVGFLVLMNDNVLVPSELIAPVAELFHQYVGLEYGLNIDKSHVPGFTSVTIAR